MIIIKTLWVIMSNNSIVIFRRALKELIIQKVVGPNPSPEMMEQKQYLIQHIGDGIGLNDIISIKSVNQSSIISDETPPRSCKRCRIRE